MSRSRIASPLSIIIVIVAIMVTTYLWLSNLAEGSRKEAYRDQTVQIQVFRAFIERLGPVEVKDGRLFAGDTALTGNRDIPEKMTRIFGGPATIFHGDVRIASTLMVSEGLSAEGTRLSGIAHDYIYHRGVTFQGETELFGVRHIVRYEVLRDRMGEAVGALFVGMPVSEFDKSYRKVRQHVLLLSGCVIAVFTFLGSAALLAGRRMENRLAESEEQYRTVFETTGCATVIVENDTFISLANNEFLRLAGLQRAAVEGKKSFGDFVRAPDREMMLEYHRLRRAGDGAAPTSYEFTFYSSDGSPQVMMCTVNMIPGTNRSVLSFLDITSRKKMERELRLTQLSVDTAGASIFRIDSEARIISVNDEAIRVLGYSREEFQSMTIMDIDPVFPKEVWDAHWEELREKGTVTIETFHRGKNGRVFPIEVTATYVEFEGVGYNFAFARDISKRKRIEQALRESEELFRHVFERSAIGIAVADLSGKILVPNASLASILGRQPSELTGLSWKELTPAEDVDAEAGIVASVLASESGYAVYDKRYVRPDGGTIWARLTLSIIRDETGAPDYFLAMVEDNTQRRLSFEELREKSEQIRLITDNAPSLIAYVDTDFRYRFVNLRYEEWFGRKREEIVGKKVEEVQPADTYRQVHHYMLRALQGEKVSYTILVRNFCNELRHLDVDYIPDVAEGTVAGLVIQVHDITNLKRAEAMLEAEREVLALIASENSLPQTLDVLCRRVEELSGDGFCSILMMAEDGETLRRCASPSLPGAFSAAIDGIRVGPSVGSCGTAAWRKEQVIITDISTDPLWEGFTKLPLRYGLHACWSTPIIAADGAVYGTFAMYYPTQRAPSAFELNLISHAGEVARIAIDRHRASESLAVVRRRLQAILNTIPDLVWLKDTDSRFIMVNAAFGNACGYSPEEIVQKTDFELWPQELAASYRHDDLRVMAAGESSIIEEPLEDHLGRRMWIETIKMPYRDDNGAVIGTTGIARNISDRKSAEEALRKSEEKFSTAFHTSPDSVSLSRLDDGTFVEVNAGFETVYGFSPGEVIGRTSLELGLWPDPLARQQLVCPLEERGEVIGLEVTFKRKDGRAITTLMSARTFERDGVSYLIAIVRDISDRKKAEQALRESEERFRELFRQNADAIILFRYSTFSVIDANPMAEDLFGYATEELRHVGHWPLIDSLEVVRFTQAVSSLETEGSFRIERMGAICKDGSRIMVSIWAKLITMDDDQVVYCSVRDITAKVQMEMAVKETQAKLIQTNKMTSLGMLVSGLAHEINNPNNFIGINSSILADVWRDARPVLQRVHGEEGVTLAGLPFHDMEAMVPRLLDGLAKGSERIAAIVRNLKDFAREDVGVSSTRIDVRKVIEDALLILTHQIHKYTDHLVVDVQDPLPWGRGNPQQIEQVIINLVMNSLQALPDRSAEISVSARHDADADLMVVTVRDQGVGMTREVLERVTEPFFSTRLAEGGTGLGLSISASIIRDHGGTLSFESEPGTGTTVRVILPVVGIPAPALTEA